MGCSSGPSTSPASEAPAAGQAAAAADSPFGKPHGTLAQVMRGIFFPNSNLLFDVQSNDPGAPKKEAGGAGATATFANIYTGWQTVENAALALAEAGTLITLPGRLCENGRPVPIDKEDYMKYARELVAAAQEMFKAAQTKNQETASDATNTVAGACENCHVVYRDKGQDVPRCVG
jgi:hypothetical protein